MICIICGTNRKNSATQVFAKHYFDVMKTKSVEVQFFSLDELPLDTFNHEMYTASGMSAELKVIQEKFIYPATKFVLVLPEYNGTYPGVLKLFIDAISVRENARNFKGKKVALVGVSDGRAGNLRGMDQVSDFMNYLGAVIMPNRLPFSQVGKLMQGRELVDADSIQLIEKHITEIINF